MLISFYNIWHTVYWVNLQHSSYWFAHLTYVLLLHYLEKHCHIDKTVRQHIVHIRKSNSFSVKFWQHFLRISCLRIVLILLLLSVEYGA